MSLLITLVLNLNLKMTQPVDDGFTS